MPLIGVVDPSHDERKTTKPGRLPAWLPIDELLEKSLNAGPRWSPYPFELLNAALGEFEERGDRISTTALTAPCPRSLVLERKEDYVLTIDELWRAFRGTMIHKVLEDASRLGAIAETRFFTEIDGEPISCKPDLITRDGTMYDYKNGADVPRYDYMYQSHNEQLQFNRWIVQHHTRAEKNDRLVLLPFNPRNMEFDHLVIVYMDLDGPKVLETTKTIEVPNKTVPGTKKRKVPDIWEDDTVLDGWEDYRGGFIPGMRPRFAALRAAFNSYPDFPEECAEVWGGPPGWGCPGFPWCPLRGKCLASRYPNGLVW